MERLPYIDEHARPIKASPERVWCALLATLRSSPNLPGWLAAAWGLDHPSRAGVWDSVVAVGDTVAGFAASEVEPAQLLRLRGRHRFSDYELSFELEELSRGRTRLRAKTSASFPGSKGRAYRALVIGTGGHRLAVRRILARVASKAEHPR